MAPDSKSVAFIHMLHEDKHQGHPNREQLHRQRLSSLIVGSPEKKDLKSPGPLMSSPKSRSAPCSRLQALFDEVQSSEYMLPPLYHRKPGIPGSKEGSDPNQDLGHEAKSSMELVEPAGIN